jgi:hypothetical protein
MATTRGKRPTKKVKTLKTKSLSAGKAKRVQGGSFSFGASTKEGTAQKIADTSLKQRLFKT